MENDETSLEFLTVMMLIKALLDSGHEEKVKEVVDEIIEQAKNNKS